MCCNIHSIADGKVSIKTDADASVTLSRLKHTLQYSLHYQQSCKAIRDELRWSERKIIRIIQFLKSLDYNVHNYIQISTRSSLTVSMVYGNRIPSLFVCLKKMLFFRCHSIICVYMPEEDISFVLSL
jgi:hypothetical protein